MSTKTTTKRVALATVVALGAGVLSLVTVSSASAATPTVIGVGDINASAGSSNTQNGDAGILFQATAPSAAGAAQQATIPTGNTSVGLVNTSDIAGGHVAGTTQTAVLLNTGALTVFETGTQASLTYDVISVTGGTISASNGTYLNTGSTLASFGAATQWGVVVVPSSGSTSMTISLYTGAAASNSTSGGALSGFINVAIQPSSTAGVVSTAKSGVWYSHNGNQATLTADDATQASAPNAPNAGTAPYGQAQWANIRVVDAFGTSIATGASHLMTATATNGAYVALAAANTVTPGTQSTAFLPGSTATDGAALTVTDPTKAPLTTVVTVSFDGVVIGTKTFTFTGQVAKITLSAPTIAKLSTTGTATIAFADAAGNAVYPSSSASTGSGSTYYPLTSLLVDPSTTNSYITGGTVRIAPTSSNSGHFDFTAGASAGSAALVVKYTNLDGSVIASNALTVAAAGAAYSYTASLNKSTYNVGDIATLTVTFKDSKGNIANDLDVITDSTAGDTPTISGGLMGNTNGSLTTNGTSSDYTTDGVITYQFVVGQPSTTPYSGQVLVNFPVVNARNSAQTTQLVAYTIGSAGTSLNDVLKGIVSLIASINKQIAALAKLVAPAKKK